MKTQGKHLLGLLFVLALFALLLSASAFADGDPAYSFDAATHTLTLTGGDYDKDHNWGSDFTKSEVWHVTAQTGVRFVGDCRQLFKNFSSCTDIDLRNVDVSGMTYAWQMFTGAQYSLTSLNVAGWDVSGLTNMNGMFSYLSRLTTLDLSSWNVSGVTGMESMFNGCSRLTSLNTTGWDVSHVTTMRNMFSSCSGLTDLDLSHWDVSSVTTVEYMFYYCSSLSNLNVANWNVSSVTSMYDMFQNCASLTTLDLSSWNVSKVTSMAGMFKACYRLTALDLSGFTVSQDTVADDLFLYADSLAELTLPAGVGVGDFMCLNNGDWYDGPPGWIVRGDATMTTVSGNGGYGDDAVIAPAAQTTTYIWKSEVFGELPALHLPGGTLSVAESAFENCGAWIVYVNDGCTAIGPGAFQNCARLQVIHIPASVTEIDATAFDGCRADLWIYGEEESAAEEFCFTNDLHFRPEIVLE